MGAPGAGRVAVPHGHGKTLPQVCARRREGRTAPRMIDGARNGRAFCVGREWVLAPTRRPGDLGTRDHLSSRQGKGVSEALDKVGAIPWYRPLYAPEIHPIKRAFSQLRR